MIILPNYRVSDIRKLFAEMFLKKDFTQNKNKTGSLTIEIIGATFIADEDSIFGEINENWIKRESEWYHSQSKNVNDIPGGAPQIWKMVASDKGFINSNYGNLIFSEENFNQFNNCLTQLELDEHSRRATMIYTRPSIQYDYCVDGMSDFICTETVQYFIRDEKLITVVKMRSNDAWAGFRNDLAWQKEVQSLLYDKLLKTYPQLLLGPIIWSVGSLHLYEKQFYLVDNFTKTGNIHISKDNWLLSNSGD